jgi:branched-chain amino acid aminotransferase
MAWSETWTFFEGEWLEGNPPLIGPRSHAFWQGSSVFDGARAFEGVTPDLDLHLARVNRSAEAMLMRPTMTVEAMSELVRDGLKRFGPNDELYIRPMYWPEANLPTSAIAPDPDTTKFALSIYVAPMPQPTGGASITLSPFRRPTPETMPVNAKAACLYPNNARALVECRSRGFDNCVLNDMLGNVAELATANIFIARDGVVMTPAPNGTFLNGITRQRVIRLMKEAGTPVVETMLNWKDVAAADEVFSVGNYGKVQPVSRVEDRPLQPGPQFRRARDLYWSFAHAA